MRRLRVPRFFSSCLLAALIFVGAGCHVKTTGEPLALETLAPPVKLSSTMGELDSRQALARGPLVLVFYRGHW